MGGHVPGPEPAPRNVARPSGEAGGPGGARSLKTQTDGLRGAESEGSETRGGHGGGREGREPRKKAQLMQSVISFWVGAYTHVTRRLGRPLPLPTAPRRPTLPHAGPRPRRAPSAPAPRASDAGSGGRKARTVHPGRAALTGRPSGPGLRASPSSTGPSPAGASSSARPRARGSSWGKGGGSRGGSLESTRRKPRARESETPGSSTPFPIPGFFSPKKSNRIYTGFSGHPPLRDWSQYS